MKKECLSVLGSLKLCISWECNLNSSKIHAQLKTMDSFSANSFILRPDCCYKEIVKPVTFNWLAGQTRFHSEFDYSNLDIALPRKGHGREFAHTIL